jgi:hypothetical protein
MHKLYLCTYLLIQLSMVAWTTSLISVHGNTVPIFLEYILCLCMCQDLGPDKLYSTLRSMTYQSSICAFWLWPGGKLQSDLGPHSMQFVVVPNLFAAVACHYGIASADREMRLCPMVSCSTSMRIRRSLIEASQDSQGARAKSNANAGV